ncbi:MAG: Ig-like domain-containing protein [Pseudomonadota bacterium]|nr:Ig-like domain-containing protein [Pseudomonadota bacterium]
MFTALLLAALVPDAAANGQTSHQWISVMAIEHVPPGDLADFLAREDVRDALLNGTMFPDGGYAVGDDYGEMAHWEPTQDLYLAWIGANHPAPYDDVGAQHVAFLLGMMSHGMADQFYDATFMERSKAWDPAESWATYSMDEATDVAYAAVQGPGTVPPKWWPEELLPLFVQNGHTVDHDTVDQGQSLLGLAIAFVGASSDVEASVTRYTEQFPWACTHQVDPTVVGNPAHEAEFVAAYWQVVWNRLQGADGWASPVIGTEPAAGGWQPVLDHTSVDGRLAVVFAKGLDPSTVEVEGAITVARADGTPVPVTLDVYYGWASHVVNIAPLEDWSADSDYTITVHPGIRTHDGLVVEEAIAIPFTTAEPPPAVDTGDTSGPAVTDDTAAGCGCATGSGSTGAAGLALLALLALRRR